MRPRSLKRQAADRAYEPTRLAVLDRDGRCILCAAVATDVHHRKQRSVGGSNDPENLVSLCRACHSDVHDDKAGMYSALGLLVPSWDREGRAPAWHNVLGRWATPTGDGWVEVDPVAAERFPVEAVLWLRARLDDRGLLWSKVHDSIPWGEA